MVSRIRFDNGMLQGPPHPRAPRSPRPPRGGWILLPSPLWGRGWRASGVIASRGGPGEGVSPIVNSYVGHHTRRQVQGAGKTLTRISHHAWTLFGRLPEGRGFSPAEIAAPTLCPSRAPRSLRLQAARGAGHGNNQKGPLTAGLKPRPSKIVVRNAG